MIECRHEPPFYCCGVQTETGCLCCDESPIEEIRHARIWRCRWCGRRVHGIFGWFHKVDRCRK